MAAFDSGNYSIYRKLIFANDLFHSQDGPYEQTKDKQTEDQRYTMTYAFMKSELPAKLTIKKSDDLSTLWQGTG